MHYLIDIRIIRSLICMAILLGLPGITTAKERLSPMKADARQVKQWNEFADNIYSLHKALVKNVDVRTEEEVGGYGGLNAGDFYKEVRYFDKHSGRLLSTIQWELERPDVIHSIEVFIYKHDQVQLDYSATYLPHHRNAPIHTLVNFYGSTDGLRSFRQFDASGERIYEQCSGSHFNADVDISLEDYELLTPNGEILALMSSESYLACFGDLPTKADKYLDPLVNVPDIQIATSSQSNEQDSHEAVRARIERLTNKISGHLAPAHLYLQRGEAYFNVLNFDKADDDLSRAIELDASLSKAWFWRGMVRGRQGRVAEGINDLTVFLERHPNSSLGYTKRGVRYIWNGELENAERDLLRAIELNPSNAEAHDDLGVILAQKQRIDEAIQHFSTTIRIEPDYQKGHHNLATALYLKGKTQAALFAVDQSLRLLPNNQGSLMLKSEILARLGRHSEAVALREQAEFLPSGNWQEQFTPSQ